MDLHSLVPDAETLLNLEPEELGEVIIECLNASPDRDNVSRYNFGLEHTVRNYPPEYHDDLRNALMEGWAWLESEGLIVPKPGSDSGWMRVSRRGRKLHSKPQVHKYRESRRLRHHELHPKIAGKARASFIRADYDTAVFQAFKEIEVAVRAAGRYDSSEIGINLMRKAFSKTGPLTDHTAPIAEQEALAHLFAGAIGFHKTLTATKTCT